MNTALPARRLPLSLHPAFAPLVSLWLAMLAGGCVAVLPGQFGVQPVAIAGCAALGGLVGWAVARVVVGVQRRRARPRPDQPAAYVERLLVGIEVITPEAEVRPGDEPLPEARRGKAVQLLRQRQTGALAMPLLVERFAVALADRSHAAAPPADLGFALYALRNALRRAARDRADSPADPRDLALAEGRSRHE